MVNPNGRLTLFKDEKATLVAKAYKGYLWSDREVRVEMSHEVKGRLKLFAAYIPEEERVRYRTYQGKTSKEFIDFLRYLRGI